MKKSILMLLGASLFAFAGCNKTEKAENDTAYVIENENVNDDYEAMSRQRASEAASQMARDLKLDADTAYQRKAGDVYYSRAARRRDVRRKYEVDTTGMASELRIIDQEADRRFQEMLNPQQYNVYQTRRTTYYSTFDESEKIGSGNDTTGSTSASAAGSQTSSDSRYPAGTTVTTKTEKDGDTKTEIEGPNGETKIKVDADGDKKTKIEGPDGKTTIKVDADGETKIKSKRSN